MIKTVKIYYVLVWLLAAGQLRGQEVAKGKVGQSKGGGQEVHKIRIDLDRAYGGTVSDYFSEIEYVPLETTKESLFGYVKKLIVTDSSFVILDNDTHAVLFFSLSGDYIGKVVKKDGYVPVQFFKDEQLNKLLIVSASGTKSKVIEYTLTGRPVREVSTKNINKDLLLYGNYMGRGLYMSLYENNFKSHNPHYINILKNDSLYNQLIFVDKESAGDLNKFYVFKKHLSKARKYRQYSNKFLFCMPFSFDIYNVTADSVRKLYQFIFPLKYQIPESIFKNSDDVDFDSLYEKYTSQNSSLILSMESIVSNDSIIIFKTITSTLGQYDGRGRLVMRNFMYSFSKSKLSSFERIRSDEKSSFLPIYTLSEFKDDIFDIKGDFLYFNVSSLDMFAAYSKNKHRNPEYPTVLQTYFKTQSRRSNPVVVRMKLRE